MSKTTDRRKLEHIRIVIADSMVERGKNYFDALRLRHRALPELDFSTVDTSTTFMGKRLALPLLISSMTGGADPELIAINRNLATAAEEAGVAMGVGSQRVMLENPAAGAGFDLREFAPRALLFANLGAAQLNYGFGIKECRAAVEHLAADALYLHLNPLQEVVQPEGDSDFAGLARKIGAVAAELGRPVILKEVGAGMGPEDAALALANGIRYIDVAGAGGTSWSRIEHHRRKSENRDDDTGLLFQDWGIPTPTALESLAGFAGELTIIASGGIRTGVEMVKSLALGASLCGIAAPFLKPAMQSAESVLALIGRLKREFAIAMFLVGARNVEQVIGNRDLLMRV